MQLIWMHFNHLKCHSKYSLDDVFFSLVIERIFTMSWRNMIKEVRAIVTSVENYSNFLNFTISIRERVSTYIDLCKVVHECQEMKFVSWKALKGQNLNYVRVQPQGRSSFLNDIFDRIHPTLNSIITFSWKKDLDL